MKRRAYLKPTSRTVMMPHRQTLLKGSADAFREAQTDDTQVYDDEGADPADAL